MTKNDLTTEDLQNIAACLNSARVDGLAAAAALLKLYHKVGLIIQAETNGDGVSANSTQPRADQPAPANDHSNTSN